MEAVQDDGGCSSTFLCARMLLTVALISHSVQICWGGEKERKKEKKQPPQRKKVFLTDSLWLKTNSCLHHSFAQASFPPALSWDDRVPGDAYISLSSSGRKNSLLGSSCCRASCGAGKVRAGPATQRGEGTGGPPAFHRAALALSRPGTGPQGFEGLLLPLGSAPTSG